MSGFQDSHVRISILTQPSRDEEVLSRKHEEKKNILSVILTDKQHVDVSFCSWEFATWLRKDVHILWVAKFFEKRKTFYRVWESEGALRIMVV